METPLWLFDFFSIQVKLRVQEVSSIMYTLRNVKLLSLSRVVPLMCSSEWSFSGPPEVDNHLFSLINIKR